MSWWIKSHLVAALSKSLTSKVPKAKKIMPHCGSQAPTLQVVKCIFVDMVYPTDAPVSFFETVTCL
jgi:hypothetical protein